MKLLMVMAGVVALAGAAPALAANANNPYGNCDKKIDNCGPTGNETTDQLNAQQLNGAPTMPAPGGPMAPGAPMPMRQ